MLPKFVICIFIVGTLSRIILCSSISHLRVSSIHPLSINSTIPLIGILSKADQVVSGDDVENNVVKFNSIQTNELYQTLQNSLNILSMGVDELSRLGWKLVQKTECFSLYKRITKTKGGPPEYMMTGEFPDVTPRSFLLYQTRESLRKLWDETLKSMSIVSQEESHAGLGIESKDVIYYRAKWPWPLKDRDYTLARRVGVFDEVNAIVFVSRAIEVNGYPKIKDVMRVDNYRCHSTFMSSGESKILAQGPNFSWNQIKNIKLLEFKKPKKKKSGSGGIGHHSHNPFAAWKAKLDDILHHTSHHGHGSSSIGKEKVLENPLDKPGVKFVTIFCDDQKVALPKIVIDAIASQAERMAATSTEKLRQHSKNTVYK